MNAIRTHGLTHVALAVRDPERSLQFYEQVFGVKAYVREPDEIQVLGPGPHDVLAFVRDEAFVGREGAIRHIGFRLVDPGDIDFAVETVLAAGGTLLRRGEFMPGFPYAFVHDPDGHELEIWFE
jgi:catechol 2,3-dioxygenase-like lactoylglutathione lyase family enzyme